MQFDLPDNLKQAVAMYDPVAKAEIKRTKASSNNKKSRNLLGSPVDLIPENIVPRNLLTQAIQKINNNESADRYHYFTRNEIVSEILTKEVTYAIIYHYEKVWYACWLPPEDKKDEYIYGYSFAFRNTESTIKSLTSFIEFKRNKLLNFNEDNIIKYGRSCFVVKQYTITKEDVNNNPVKSDSDYLSNSINNIYYCNIPSVASYSKKGKDIYKCIVKFVDSLTETIPTWKTSRNYYSEEIFKRMRYTNISTYLFGIDASYPNKVHDDFWISHNQSEFVLSFDSFIEIINYHHSRNTEKFYRGMKYASLRPILPIIGTPFFKKWISNTIDQCNNNFNDLDNKDLDKVTGPWEKMIDTLLRIKTINAIWPNCPVDYYRTNIDQISTIVFIDDSNIHPTAKQWLNTNMPVSSFFLIVDKFYESVKEKLAEGHVARSLRLTSWDDSIHMIEKILVAGKEIEPPKRWRINEFHDYVLAESWKIVNPNEIIPKDLFPEPIKLSGDSDGSLWTFFQPHDTHQLASWGRAVRNCVGNAASYAEGVRNKKHFIVLCMIDNNPKFTIQLAVNGGVMTVDQIVSLSNSHLNQEERNLYCSAFSRALQIRDQQLALPQAQESMELA